MRASVTTVASDSLVVPNTSYVARASETQSLIYDISRWGEYGLPSDGYFARTLRESDVRALMAGERIEFGGRTIPPYADLKTRTLVEYPEGAGFVSAAEDLRVFSTGSQMKRELDLNYEPEFILEFQLKDTSQLQNILYFDDPLFKGKGTTLHGQPEWNYPGITSDNIVNWQIRQIQK